MKITNLDDLRKATDKNTVKKIATEYMLETIARANILECMENYIGNKRDETTITVRELKDKLDEFADANNLFED